MVFVDDTLKFISIMSTE